MFGNSSAVEITEAANDVVAADLVPLSHLELDLPRPAEGWANYLGRRAIKFVPDDLGRDCVRRQDARRLLDEQRELQLRKATLAKVAEQEAVEADRIRLASIWKGLPADQLPVGVAAGDAMLQAAKDAQPKRRSLLDDALAGETVFHPLPAADEE
jgi:hypothetical protein